MAVLKTEQRGVIEDLGWNVGLGGLDFLQIA